MPELAQRSAVLKSVDGVVRVVDADPWQIMDETAIEAVEQLPAHALVSLAWAKTHASEWARWDRPWGICLAPDDEPSDVEPFLRQLSLIAVQFPAFTDGRGYSSAYLVRARLGWVGELRAVGDVLQDQLRAMQRVGFDSFALRAGKDPRRALAAFASISVVYQASMAPIGVKADVA